MARRARGSLFRRRRAGRLEDVWTIKFRLSNGKVRTERAYSDKAASEQLLAQRLREAAREEVGLADPYRRHRRRPIAEHLADFLAGIGSRHRTAKHANLIRARLQRAFEAMSAANLDDLDQARAEGFLCRLLADGSSVATRDHYAHALRQFGAWLVDTDRAPRNVFHRLRPVRRPADVTRRRLALDPQQVLRLVEAAEVRPVQCYRKSHPQAQPETLERLARAGRQRGLLYLFSALTGLRSSECKGIRWRDLDLAEGNAWVTPRAETTKNRKTEPLPLDEQLAGRLREFRTAAAQGGRGVPPATAAVFHVAKNLPEQLRKDAEWAEIPVVDDDGRRLDFHALRATYATLIARAGVPLQMGRRLIRHTDPALTAKHYEKLSQANLRDGTDLAGGLFWREALSPQVTPNESARKETEGDESATNLSRGKAAKRGAQ